MVQYSTLNNTILTKKGDLGHTYYIVIQGELDLLMPNIQKEDNIEYNLKE